MNRYRTFLQICRFIYGIVWALIDLAFYSKYVRIKLHSMLQPFQQSVAGFISIITLLFSLQRWHEFRIWLRNYPKKIWLLQRLNNSKTYEEWGQYANALDYYYGADKWRAEPASPLYNYQNITARLERILTAQADDDPLKVCNTIRSGLIRNMVNIAVPELYEQSFAGTKRLIERYVADQALSIRYLMSLRTDQPHRTGFSAQQKLDFIRGARQGLGRSTLLFQGGSVSGLCHIGVARVLYNQRLLPRVITGTSTGAFVAALICVKRRHELEAFFRDNVIDLESYRRRPRQSQFRLLRLFSREAGYGWCHTMFRRTIRYVNDRYLRDHNILQECARSDIGDMTFEEAYRRTKRVLNITVAMSKSGGTPVLFNYLTTPHVLIWSAAMASNISCAAKTPVEMFCKDETGKIVPWGPPGGFKPQSWVFFRYRRKESPLRRLPELFNINHYIVSQARPFIIPLFGENIHRPGNEVQCGRWWIKRKMDNLVNIETRCRLRQFDVFGLLPSLAYRILLEEYYPAAAIALRPDIRIEDMKRCFHEPTPQDVEESILLGERGVWPSLCSLKVRCLLEVELEKAYQDLTKKLDNEIQVNW